MAQATIDTTVSGIQGTPVSSTPPTVGQVLIFNGTAWVPGTSINGPLTVSGAFNAGSLTTAGVLTVNGPISAPGGITISGTGGLFVNGTSTLNGAVGAPGGITIESAEALAFAPSGYSMVPTPGSGLVINTNLVANANNYASLGITGVAWNNAFAYAFTQVSDPRDKRDMAPAPTGALNKVKALPVITYRLKDNQLRIGFDAVQVHRVHPDAVAMDDKGASPRGYSLSDMNALLWQAVQELAAKVSALEAR